MPEHLAMSSIKTSYVISTFNRLEFLKALVADIREEILESEEIIIVDGNSTDGSKEWIKEAKAQGSIDQFVCEADQGEAHGFNKGIMLAQGEFIKILTVDDIFHFDLIRRCVKHMTLHVEIDWMASNILTYVIGAETYKVIDYQTSYQQWKQEEISRFRFHGQGWILRRSSLPILGLLNPAFLAVDTEYSLRITQARQATLAWCNAPMGMRVTHDNSIAVTRAEKLNQQTNRLFEFYKSIDLGRPLGGLKDRAKQMIQPKNDSINTTIGEPIKEVVSISPIDEVPINETVRKSFLEMLEAEVEQREKRLII